MQEIQSHRRKSGVLDFFVFDFFCFFFSKILFARLAPIIAPDAPRRSSNISAKTVGGLRWLVRVCSRVEKKERFLKKFKKKAHANLHFLLRGLDQARVTAAMHGWRVRKPFLFVGAYKVSNFLS
jgi:hypothetical protein